LIATAAGLAAAIPAVIFYNYYLNRIKTMTLRDGQFLVGAASHRRAVLR